MVSTALAYPNEPDGFRGLKWGTPLSDIQETMTHFYDYNGLEIYGRENDEKMIGLARLGGISYRFWHGKLHSVSIDTTGYDNWTNLHESLIAKFGHGMKLNRYTYSWNDKTTDIYISYNYVSNKSILQFTSKAMEKEKESWEKDQAKKANF
jgi:hypothetical protein